jgi:O-antigen ligase
MRADSMYSRRAVLQGFVVGGIALYIVMSGYAYTSIGTNTLTVNNEGRAVSLVLLMLLSLGALVGLQSTVRIPKIAFLYFLPVAYMSGIALVNLQPYEYIPSVIRWISYVALGLYFYNVPNPERSFRLFISVMGVSLVLQGMVDMIYSRGMFINNAFRVGGGVGSPIGFAGSLFVTGFSAFYFWTQTKNVFYLVLSMLSAIVIVFTGTRSIFVAYAFILPMFYFLQARGGLRKAAAFILGASLLAALSWYVLFETELGARLAFKTLDQDSSAGFRIFLLTTVLAEYEGLQAVFGVGIGGFPGWFSSLTGLDGVAPHFEFVWVMVEGGLVGSALYVICLFLVILNLLVLRYRGRVLAPQFWFLLILALSPQFVFQFTNPNYFYQVMVPLVAGTAALLAQTRTLRCILQLADSGPSSRVV